MRILLLFICLALWSLVGCMSYGSGFQSSETSVQRAKKNEEEIALLISMLDVHGQAARNVEQSYYGLEWWVLKKGYSEATLALAFEHVGDMDGNGQVDQADPVVVGYLAVLKVALASGSPNTDLERAMQEGSLMLQLDRIGFFKGSEGIKPMPIKSLQQWGRTLPILLDLWDDDGSRSNNQELFNILHEVFSAFMSLGEELFLLEVEKRLENKGQSEPAEEVLSPLKNLI